MYMRYFLQIFNRQLTNCYFEFILIKYTLIFIMKRKKRWEKYYFNRKKLYWIIISNIRLFILYRLNLIVAQLIIIYIIQVLICSDVQYCFRTVCWLWLRFERFGMIERDPATGLKEGAAKVGDPPAEIENQYNVARGEPTVAKRIYIRRATSALARGFEVMSPAFRQTATTRTRGWRYVAIFVAAHSVFILATSS